MSMSQTVARTKRKKKKSHISISLTFVSLQNRVSFLWSVTSRTCFSMRCHVEVHLDNTRAQRRPQRCAAGPESAIEKKTNQSIRVRPPPTLSFSSQSALFSGGCRFLLLQESQFGGGATYTQSSLACMHHIRTRILWRVLCTCLVYSSNYVWDQNTFNRF